jgi:hypothetical protein
MALIAVTRGKPKRGLPPLLQQQALCKLWSIMYSTILPLIKIHLKQTTVVVGVRVKKKMLHP